LFISIIFRIFAKEDWGNTRFDNSFSFNKKPRKDIGLIALSMINYTKVSRSITVGYNPGMKYLASLVRNGVLTQERLCDRISAASSLAYNDVLSCIAALQAEIVEATMDGITVELDQLGRFTPYLLAKAMETAEEVDVTTIKRTRVNFKPNSRFLNRLKTTGYTYKEVIPKGYVDPNATPPVIP